MTERGRAGLARDAASLSIGPSSFAWGGDGLTIRLDERTVPWPSRLRGTVRVRPGAVSTTRFALDAAGRHSWRPVAPAAAIEVELDAPTLRWSGHAYLDMNAGSVPLETDFRQWTWSRAAVADGSAILYDVERRDGSRLALALSIDGSGRIEPFHPPPPVDLPPTRWRMTRQTRSDAGHGAAVVRTFEDAPFYARSLVAAHLLGQPVTAVHESLSLDRFRRSIVQAMLPFRMPRRVG